MVMRIIKRIKRAGLSWEQIKQKLETEGAFNVADLLHAYALYKTGVKTIDEIARGVNKLSVEAIVIEMMSRMDFDIFIPFFASIFSSSNFSVDKAASIFNNDILSLDKAASIMDNISPSDRAASILNNANLSVDRAAAIIDNVNLSVDKVASICDSDSITSERIKAILDTGNLTVADKIAALLDGDSLTADDAAAHVDLGVYTDDLMAASFESSYLSDVKAASIFDSVNLSAAKLQSILDNTNLSIQKGQRIVEKMSNPSKIGTGGRRGIIGDDWEDNKLTSRDNAATVASGLGRIVQKFRPEWNVISGTPTVSSGKLYLDNTCELQISCSHVVGAWQFKIEWVGRGYYTSWCYIKFMCVDANNAYYFKTSSRNSSSEHGLCKIVNGEATSLITFALDSSVRIIKITRDSNGNFEIFRDGESQGTVTDTDITSSNYFNIKFNKSTYGNLYLDNLEVY